MNKFREFIKTSMIGGIIIVLPIALMIIIFSWLFRFITGLVHPATDILMNDNLPQFVGDFMVLSIIVGVSFVVGAIVKTRFGRFIHHELEKRVLEVAPGYSVIKEIVLQFIGRKNSSFSKVVLAKPFGNDTMVTGFLVEEHDSGYCTIFVPFGLAPTAGNIYHIKKEFIIIVDVSVEDTFRSIIGCGGGSKVLLNKYEETAVYIKK